MLDNLFEIVLAWFFIWFVFWGVFLVLRKKKIINQITNFIIISFYFIALQSLLFISFEDIFIDLLDRVNLFHIILILFVLAFDLVITYITYITPKIFHSTRKFFKKYAFLKMRFEYFFPKF